MKLNIEVIKRQRKIKISTKRVIYTLKKVEKTLLTIKNKKFLNIIKNYSSLSVSIVFVSKKKMKELNFKYRKKNSTTDVLSFPYLEPELPDNLYIGEILIDPERVYCQSKLYGITFWQELTRVLIHGFLHLIGYDHEKSVNQAKKMSKLEEKILSNLQS